MVDAWDAISSKLSGLFGQISNKYKEQANTDPKPTPVEAPTVSATGPVLHTSFTPKLMVVDIYHGDDVVDFKAAKASGIVGIIHKATQGTNYTDPTYASRRQAAVNAGLLWGAYHFASSQDVTAQVNKFLSVANPDKDTLIALDHETNTTGGTISIKQTIDFLKMIEFRLGRKAVIYSGNLLKQQLGDNVDTYIGSHRLWLAEYNPKWHVQKSFSAPWLWQYKEGTSKVPGIPGASGKLDYNSYGGTNQQLEKDWAS